MNVAHLAGMDDEWFWEPVPFGSEGGRIWIMCEEGFEYRMMASGKEMWAVERRSVRPCSRKEGQRNG